LERWGYEAGRKSWLVFPQFGGTKLAPACLSSSCLAVFYVNPTLGPEFEKFSEPVGVED